MRPKAGLKLSPFVYAQVRVGICIWLAKFLRMSRPGQTTHEVLSSSSTTSNRKSTSSSSTSKKLDIFQQTSSRSLLANVLDLEDDFLLLNLTAGGTRARRVQVPTSIELPCLTTAQVSRTGTPDDDRLYPRRHGPPGRLNGTPGGCVPSDGPGSTTSWPGDCCDLECALLTDVLDEVKYLTGRMRQDAATQRVCSEWKFAAMVVDRLCLWLFSIFTLVSTGTILLSAPDVRSIFRQ